MNPSQQGAIAEAAVAFEAIKLGIGVLKPIFEGGRYDWSSTCVISSCACNARSPDAAVTLSTSKPEAVGVLLVGVTRDERTVPMKWTPSPHIALTSTAATSCR